MDRHGSIAQSYQNLFSCVLCRRQYALLVLVLITQSQWSTLFSYRINSLIVLGSLVRVAFLDNVCIVSGQTSEAGNLKYCPQLHARSGLRFMISPTHKRTEGRAPVWGSEFTSKRRRTTGGGYSRIRCRLNVKLRTSVTGGAWLHLFLPLFITQ